MNRAERRLLRRLLLRTDAVSDCAERIHPAARKTWHQKRRVVARLVVGLFLGNGLA